MSATGNQVTDSDKLARPLVEAAKRWASIRGLGYVAGYNARSGYWEVDIEASPRLAVRVSTVSGRAWIERFAYEAKTARGVGIILRRAQDRSR